MIVACQSISGKTFKDPEWIVSYTVFYTQIMCDVLEMVTANSPINQMFNLKSKIVFLVFKIRVIKVLI